MHHRAGQCASASEQARHSQRTETRIPDRQQYGNRLCSHCQKLDAAPPELRRRDYPLRPRPEDSLSARNTKHCRQRLCGRSNRLTPLVSHEGSPRQRNVSSAFRLTKQAQLPRASVFCLARPRRQIRYGRQVALQLCMQTCGKLRRESFGR